jgi:Recombinase
VAVAVAVVMGGVAERNAGLSLRAIADGLTRDGIATAHGGRAWHASTVRKVLASQQAGAVLHKLQRAIRWRQRLCCRLS